MSVSGELLFKTKKHVFVLNLKYVLAILKQNKNKQIILIISVSTKLCCVGQRNKVSLVNATKFRCQRNKVSLVNATKFRCQRNKVSLAKRDTLYISKKEKNFFRKREMRGRAVFFKSNQFFFVTAIFSGLHPQKPLCLFFRIFGNKRI